MPRAQTAAERLRRSGREVVVIVGSDPLDGAAQASAAIETGAEALVVVGGDGVVQLAVQLVAGTDVPLGVIPAGTGNDFARELGIPEDPAQAAEMLAAWLDSGARTVDLGRCGDRWFATVLASGFDSRVSERANRLRWPRGKARYNLAILAELGVFRPISYTLDIDGERIDTEAMLVAVGNTTSYGGGMRITPEARVDDGLLDVVVIGRMPKWRLVTSFPRLYQGTHVNDPRVTTYRGSRITVSAPEVTAYADGEPLGPLPATCECVPRALRVLAPRST